LLASAPAGKSQQYSADHRLFVSGSFVSKMHSEGGSNI